MYVRGCEIEGMLDAEGRVIEERPDSKPEFAGDTRTFRVWLDPNQYQKDMAKTIQGYEVRKIVINVMHFHALKLLKYKMYYRIFEIFDYFYH